MKKRNVQEEIKQLEEELADLHKCYELMPKTTFLGVKSLEAVIRSKTNKLKKLRESCVS